MSAPHLHIAVAWLAGFMTLALGSAAQAGFQHVRHLAVGRGEARLYDGGTQESAEDATTDVSDLEILFSAHDAISPTVGPPFVGAYGRSVIVFGDDELTVNVEADTRYIPEDVLLGGEARVDLESMIEFEMPADQIRWSYYIQTRPTADAGSTFVVSVGDVSSGVTLAHFDGYGDGTDRILDAARGHWIRILVQIHGEISVAAGVPGNRVWDATANIAFTNVDCNNNGLYDPREIAERIGADYNLDGLPDDCNAPVIYVNASAQIPGDGSSWQAALVDLQTAIDIVAQRTPQVSPIWIAEGTYIPSRRLNESDPRSATFSLIGGIDLYGGFAGSEAHLSERDLQANPTILSGDLLGDDLPAFINRGDNTYHVLLKDGHEGSVLLDGLTIRGGQADGGSHGFGGGLHSEGPLLLHNCDFIDNWAGVVRTAYGDGTVAHSNGGGAVAAFTLGEMDDETNEPTIVWENCRFADNASSGTGGAVFLASASLKFVGCTFERNSAPNSGAIGTESIGALVLDNCAFVENASAGDYSNGGGAVSVFYGAMKFEVVGCDFQRNAGTSGGAIFDYGGLVLKDTRFQDNSASEFGGAVYETDAIFGSAFADCEFDGNRAPHGGAVYLSYSDGASLTHCQFANNAADQGGAVYARNTTLVLLESMFDRNHAAIGGAVAIDGNDYDSCLAMRSRFLGNYATVGGALSVAQSNPALLIIDDLLAGNWAELYGGAVAGGPGDLLISHCTIVDNASGALGAGIIGGASTSVRNSVFWSNVVDPHGDAVADQDAQIENLDAADVNYSIVKGWTGGEVGVGNSGVDPLFADPKGPDGWPGTGDEDYRLSPGSPAIDAGDPDYIPPPGDADLNGHARVLCGRVDIGAYEFGIGDFDCDQRVDAVDFAAFPGCMEGPLVFRRLLAAIDNRQSAIDNPCAALDSNADADIDLADFASFQIEFGPAQ